MSASIPLSSGMPPPAWSDATLGSVRHAPAPSAGGTDWFGTSSSARTLSVRLDSAAHGDVESWAQALVNHLIEPADTPR